MRTNSIFDLKAEFLKVYYQNTTISKFVNFYHPLVCLLHTTLYRDGFPSFFSRTTQLSATTFDFNLKYQPTDNVDLVYPVEDLEFNIQDAYANYNWELFFHIPFEMASLLSQDQQFEAARDWYQLHLQSAGQRHG